jgi:hypothetical protein
MSPLSPPRLHVAGGVVLTDELAPVLASPSPPPRLPPPFRRASVRSRRRRALVRSPRRAIKAPVSDQPRSERASVRSRRRAVRTPASPPRGVRPRHVHAILHHATMVSATPVRHSSPLPQKWVLDVPVPLWSRSSAFPCRRQAGCGHRRHHVCQGQPPPLFQFRAASPARDGPARGGPW